MLPRRFLDLVEKRALYLENVDIVVLDEADRMADMGFMEPVCEILTHAAGIDRPSCSALLWMMRSQN